MQPGLCLLRAVWPWQLWVISRPLAQEDCNWTPRWSHLVRYYSTWRISRPGADSSTKCLSGRDDRRSQISAYSSKLLNLMALLYMMRINLWTSVAHNSITYAWYVGSCSKTCCSADSIDKDVIVVSTSLPHGETSNSRRSYESPFVWEGLLKIILTEYLTPRW